MAQESPLPESLSLADLAAACRRETRRFRNASVSDPRFCLEIFRRALRHTARILEATATTHVAERLEEVGNALSGAAVAPSYHDEAARTILVQIYTDYIKAHISREAARITPLDDLVQQVWLRFWRAANNNLAFHSLEAALLYLKQTTISALLEEQRTARKHRRHESLEVIVAATGEDALRDQEADLFGQLAQQRFRVRCREVLVDPLEYRVFWMRYGLGMPPRDIARELAGESTPGPDRRPTARSISDVLERCCRRLRQDLEIQELLAGD